MKQTYSLILIIGVCYSVFLLVVIPFPGDTDAYYHFNASQRLASGEGLTDSYLWNYLYQPESLPGPAYSYWMPLYTFLAAPLMVILGTSFKVALLPTLISWLFFALSAVYIMDYLGGKPRQQIIVGLLMYFSGIFTAAMASTDVYVLYGALGTWSLISMGLGYQKKQLKWLIFASVLGALASLTRNDGPLLIGLAGIFAFLIGSTWQKRLLNAIVVGGVAFFMLVPWYIRNYLVMGSPFSQGGLNTIFLQEYEALFSINPEMDARQFWNWGLTNILQSRWTVLTKNARDFFLIQGFIILMPFALYGWWQHRHIKFLRGFTLYAILLHIIMTFIFALPGQHGSLLHSATALMPFWGVLGLLGLEKSVHALGEKLNWARSDHYVRVTSFGVVWLIVIFSLVGLVSFQKEKRLDYKALDAILADDSRVMVFDPVEFYYFTNQVGVIMPNDSLETAREIATQYCIRYLVLTDNAWDTYQPLINDAPNSPEFLQWIAHVESDGIDGDIEIYEFIGTPRQCEMENK